jgi:hypothetical protein
MLLRLPVSGLVLKYKHKHIRALVEELAAHDRDIADLSKDQWLTATRLLQVGRAFEQTITLDEADEIIDTEKEGGVDFDELVAAMIKAFRGKRGVTLRAHAEDEPAEDEAGTAPKKSDLHSVPALGRVS